MRTPVKNAGRMHTVTALLGLVVTLNASELASANSQHSLYRADQQRTGRSGYAATYKPDRVWTFGTGSTVSAAPVLGRNGEVYFAAYDKHLYCVTGKGTLEWRKMVNSIACGSAAVDSSGNVYAGTVAGTLHSLDPNGSYLWSGPVSLGLGPISGSALISSQGNIYLGTESNWICALNQDGALKWKLLTGGSIMHSLTASPDGSVIYAPSSDGSLYAVTHDGELRWARSGISPTSNCAVGSDGTIYAGSSDGALYAISPHGSILWRYQTMGRITTAPAIATDGTIYFGSYDSNLYAINPNGTLKWYHRSYTSIYSSPTIDYFGTIIYGSWDGKVIALNPSNGTVSWSRAVANRLYASPVIGPDGSIYITDSAGNLIGISGPAQMVTPEPSTMLALAAAIAVTAGAGLRRKA